MKAQLFNDYEKMECYNTVKEMMGFEATGYWYTAYRQFGGGLLILENGQEYALYDAEEVEEEGLETLLNI